MINIIAVAGAALLTPFSLVNYLSERSFVKISSIHLHSQTVRARELIFLEKVHLPYM